MTIRVHRGGRRPFFLGILLFESSEIPFHPLTVPSLVVSAHSDVTPARVGHDVQAFFDLAKKRDHSTNRERKNVTTID